MLKRVGHFCLQKDRKKFSRIWTYIKDDEKDDFQNHR